MNLIIGADVGAGGDCSSVLVRRVVHDPMSMSLRIGCFGVFEGVFSYQTRRVFSAQIVFFCQCVIRFSLTARVTCRVALDRSSARFPLPTLHISQGPFRFSTFLLERYHTAHRTFEETSDEVETRKDKGACAVRALR